VDLIPTKAVYCSEPLNCNMYNDRFIETVLTPKNIPSNTNWKYTAFVCFHVKRRAAELDRNELNTTFKKNQIRFLLAPDREFHLLHTALLTRYNDSEYLPTQSLIDETKSELST
jgi:hypothetical protein